MYIRGINVLTETGFGAALIYKQNDFDEARDTAFTLMVARGVLLALITLVCAPFIAMFFEQDVISSLISVLALSMLFSGFLNMNTVLKQKELDFKSLVYLEQIHIMANFFLVISLAYIYRSIWALAIAHVVTSLVYVLLSYLLIPGSPKFAFNKKLAWELFHYGKYITGLSIVVFITTEIDNAVGGKILGVEALGFYVLAYTLANLPATHFSKILSKILFPVFSKLQNDISALQLVLYQAIKFVSLVTIPASLLLIVLAEELVTVIYGERWSTSASTLQILAIFGMLRAITSLNGYLYNAIGKPYIPFYFNTGKLIVIAIIIVPMTTIYGIEGTALAVTIPLVIQFFLSLFVLCRILASSYLGMLTLVLKVSIKSLTMALAIYYLKQHLSGFNIMGLLGLLVTAGVIYLAMTFREIIELINLVTTNRQQAQN